MLVDVDSENKDKEKRLEISSKRGSGGCSRSSGLGETRSG